MNPATTRIIGTLLVPLKVICEWIVTDSAAPLFVVPSIVIVPDCGKPPVVLGSATAAVVSVRVVLTATAADPVGVTVPVTTSFEVPSSTWVPVSSPLTVNTWDSESVSDEFAVVCVPFAEVFVRTAAVVVGPNAA